MLNVRALLAVWMAVMTLLSPAISSRPVDAAEAKLELAIVVARNSPLEELSIHDLKNLYLGDRISGPGGKSLIPVALRAGSSERAAFEQTVLRMSADSLTKHWIDRKIRGQSGPPKSVESAELLQLVVSKLDGGIGYVSASDLRNVVKVVRIDGKAPGEPGYRIGL